MAIDPWIYAVHHFAAGVDAQYATGDGALNTISTPCTLVSDSALSRVVLNAPGTNINSPYPEEVRASKAITAATSLVFGIRAKAVSVDNVRGSGTRTFLSFRNASGELLNLARDKDDSHFHLRRGTTELADLGVMTLDEWIYIEGLLGFHASTGYATIAINGVVVSTLTAQNTAGVTVGSGCTSWEPYGPAGTSSVMRFTDFYIKDEPVSGSPFWGPISPRWRAVTADVGASGFTPDTGSDLYARLATMTGYIQATAIADYAEFELDALPAGIGSIIAQVGITVAEAPLGGAPAIAHDFHYGSDTTAVAGRVTGSTAPRTQARLHLTQPDGSPWDAVAAAGGSGGSKLLLTAV